MKITIFGAQGSSVYNFPLMTIPGFGDLTTALNTATTAADTATAAASGAQASSALAEGHKNAAAANAATIAAELFSSRADFVTWAASNTPVNGREYRADGLSYRGEAGAMAIADLPGLVPSGDLTWMHFGAAGDGSDDTAAFNAALAYIRAANNTTTLQRPYVISGMGKIFTIAGSINATKMTLGRGWGIRDTCIDGTGAGKTVLDLTGSRYGLFDNLNIWGGRQFDAANDPHTGVLIARALPGDVYPCDTHTFNNCSVDGYFTHSAYTEYASEITSHTGCLFWNRRVASGGNPCWAAVLQGRPTVAMVSDYQPFATGRQSYTVKHYDRCLIQKPFGLAGPTLYIEDMASAKFTKPYFTNGAGTIVSWKVNNDFAPYSIEFDGLQIETTGTERAFMFTGAGNVVVDNLSVSCGNLFTSVAMFDMFGPAQVLLSNFKLSSPRWFVGKPTNVFAQTSKFKITGGCIELPAASDIESFNTFVSGSNYELFGASGQVRRNYGPLRLAAGAPILAEGHTQVSTGQAMLDNTAITINLTTLGIPTSGVLTFWTTVAGVAGTIHYRADAVPLILLKTVGVNTDVATATTLAGATGVDGQFTVAINNGAVMMENRIGFQVSIRYHFLTFNASI